MTLCMAAADLVLWQRFKGNSISNGSQGQQQRLHVEWSRQDYLLRNPQDSKVTGSFQYMLSLY